MTRLEELYAQLTSPDDGDLAVAAIDLLEQEAVPEWLPTLHEWMVRELPVCPRRFPRGREVSIAKT